MDFKWGYAVGGLMAGLGLSAGVAALYGLHIGAVKAESAGVLSVLGTLGTVGAAAAAAYSAKLSKEAAETSASIALESERGSAFAQAYTLYLKAEKKAERADKLADDLLSASPWSPEEVRIQMMNEINDHSGSYGKVAKEAVEIMSQVAATRRLADLWSHKIALKALSAMIAGTDWDHEKARSRWLRRVGPGVALGDDNDVLSV